MNKIAQKVLIKLGQADQKKKQKAVGAMGAAGAGIAGGFAGNLGKTLYTMPFSFGRKGEEIRSMIGGQVGTPPKITEDFTNKLIRAGGRTPEELKTIVSSGLPAGPAFRPKAPIIDRISKSKIYKKLLKDLPADALETAKTGPLQYLQKPGSDALFLPPGAHPEGIGHEVGHATAKGIPAKLVDRLSRLSRKALPLPLLMSMHGAFTDDDSSIAKAAPYVGGGQLASILGEEVRATTRGHKLLRQVGEKVPKGALWKMLKGPTATYGSLAFPLIAGPLVASKIIEMMKEE